MTTADLCAICGEPAPERQFLHECYGCGRLYHLNPYANRPGKDCGDAVLGNEELGLFYYCDHCLREIDDEYRAATNSPPAPGTDASASLPPRAERPAVRRRYRRIDGA